jgi:hypothetical protein
MPAFLRSRAGLKIIASAVLLEKHPLERTVRWRHRRRHAFDDIGRAQMLLKLLGHLSESSLDDLQSPIVMTLPADSV